jgi:hypothetical protein
LNNRFLPSETLCFVDPLIRNSDPLRPVSARRLTEIHPDMSRNQVLAILGKPFVAESKDGVESLYFNLSVDRFREAAFGGVMRLLNIGKKHFRVDLK